MRSMLFVATLAASLIFVIAQAQADVRLPAIIGDNMVLQQDANAPIWGWAEPGEKVSVTFGDQRKTAQAGDKGQWRIVLRTPKAGGPCEMTVAGKNTLTLKNILVGEVWLCSGQSNMGFVTKQAANAAEEIARAPNPKIRFFKVPMNAVDEPQVDVKGQWVECTSETAATFSAVGYFFGRELHAARREPIGLIESAVGGTPAEAWTSREALKAKPELTPVFDRYEQALRVLPQAQKAYETRLAKWKDAVKQLRKEGKKTFPRAPQPPMGPANKNHPCGLFNGMIAPLIPFSIEGAIWYQGESNATRAEEYKTLFPAMIADWRARWDEADFPFLFVQLANFRTPQTDPNEASGWALLREAQLQTLRAPKTSMAVSIDIGMADNIHPTNKQDVGRRLALAARAVAYGEKGLVYSGPLYRSMAVKDGAVHLSFDRLGGGLAAKGGGPLKGFVIAGEDRKFVWADARVEGDEVIVSAREVAKPAAVRYGWANNPAVNLYNKEGLPASPFRTDDWPIGEESGIRN